MAYRAVTRRDHRRTCCCRETGFHKRNATPAAWAHAWFICQIAWLIEAKSNHLKERDHVGYIECCSGTYPCNGTDRVSGKRKNDRAGASFKKSIAEQNCDRR